jgi:DNA polymerase-1
MAKAGKLWLVDGSSYLYRAFFALPPLTTTTGVPTGAVLGVLNMLNKLVKEENPELIAVVLDAPGRTFRDDLFEEYKAHRPPMPDDLRSQIAPLIEAIPALGLPLLQIAGVEADDVIGTLAERAATEGLEVVISTGDKDMAQLVNDRITCVNTMFDTKLDRAGVKAKFDVLPGQIVDYLALVGDSSDNIPGVPKVGPKTAAKWLNEYGSVDGIVERAKDITGKVGESLRENLATLELSRKLATIRRDLELPLTPRELTRKPADIGVLSALYSRLEMNSLLRQLTGVPAPGASDRDAASERVSSGGASEPGSRPHTARDRIRGASVREFVRQADDQDTERDESDLLDRSACIHATVKSRDEIGHGDVEKTRSSDRECVRQDVKRFGHEIPRHDRPRDRGEADRDIQHKRAAAAHAAVQQDREIAHFLRNLVREYGDRRDDAEVGIRHERGCD